MKTKVGKKYLFKHIDARTDLALEAREMLGIKGEVPGVRVEKEKKGQALVTRVEIFSDEGEQVLGKVKGNYITIEAAGLRKRNRELQEAVGKVLADELSRLMGLDDDTKVFVVGLGNWNATPDALGPQVIANLLITRHLHEHTPEEVRGGLRSVCALAPGVLGLTGIETGEIILGIVDRIKPDLVLAVDALAARNLERIMTTIQISDTGIHPGSGVGNKRVGITRETVGIPIYALGVPTVVHAVTIAADTIELLIDQFRGEVKFYDILEEMDSQEQRNLINEVLSTSVGDLMVTPKEIDVYIEDIARTLAGGINSALHPKISYDEVMRYIM